MFSYIMLGTNDLPRAIRFYDPLMEMLGQPQSGRSDQGASWGTFSGNSTIGLCVGQPFNQQQATTGNGVMVALNARSVEHIQQLQRLSHSVRKRFCCSDAFPQSDGLSFHDRMP